MISIQTIRENAEWVIERLAIKHIDAKTVISQILEIDEQRRSVQKEVDDLKAQNNKMAKEIGMLFKSGNTSEANALKENVGVAKETIKKLDARFAELEGEQLNLLLSLPNIPHEKVPQGKLPADNVTVKQSGNLRPADGLLPHWELASKYNLIDFELGNKIAGAGFPVYRGKGARLQRALLNFFLDQNTAAGYEETQPPIVVNEDSAYGTGQLPDKEGQMYHVTEDNLYLIPTAEVPLTNIYRDVLLNEKELPIKITGYTPCFRREAGSYGKDVRGLNRLHQFDKVEIVQVQKPEDSYAALDEMVAHVEGILNKLQLPYRILALCGGDMSFASAFTYDFEVYSAAQERWLEVSSVSNFESFQANRLKLRYKNSEGKNQLAHTLNGSSLAFPRILACILENYQTYDGIKIPDVLVPYCGFDSI
ncbi:serine--tRNA ligase [bacterium]|nr:serine--tRNA ligase [bacterium]